MSSFKQIRAVTGMGLRGLPSRFGTSMVVVVGVAVVVAVLVAALTIAAGFTAAAAKTGERSRAIILTADTEAAGTLSRENSVTVRDAPGIAKRGPGGAPIVSSEALVFLPLTDARTGLNSFVTLRGVGAEAFALRPEQRVVEGRTFARGAHEILVGRAAQRRLSSLQVGSVVSLPNGRWSVVGVFESGGDSHESEMMTDVDALMDAYQANSYNSVTVRLTGDDGLATLQAALTADPTIAARALREDEYFQAASRQVSLFLKVVAYGIGGIMAFGAIFGALNTMYAAVSSRATEIATLRAIGFGASPVVMSVLIEALLLALAGGALGALLAWVLLDETTVSTVTGVTPSQLTFGLTVSPAVILVGIVFACAIALVGGLFAAIRAARVSVVAALRMV